MLSSWALFGLLDFYINNNLKPKKPINMLTYHKILFDALNTLVTRNVGFRKFSFKVCYRTRPQWSLFHEYLVYNGYCKERPLCFFKKNARLNNYCKNIMSTKVTLCNKGVFQSKCMFYCKTRK